MIFVQLKTVAQSQNHKHFLEGILKHTEAQNIMTQTVPDAHCLVHNELDLTGKR